MNANDIRKVIDLVDIYNIYEFFANCDGRLWSDQEIILLDDYKKQLIDAGILNTEESIIIFDKMQQIEYSRLDQVIDATKSVLNSAGDDKDDLLKVINEGIHKVIYADGRVTADEFAFYNEWKRVFGLM